jgi:hypothetical protein
MIPPKPPLATLSRGTVAVRLHERFAQMDIGSPRRVFRHQHDAETFLRSWMREPGAMMDLRRVLARSDRSATLHRLSDDDVIRALSTALVSGAIVISEGASHPLPNPLLAPEAATVEPPTVPLNPGVDMPLAPALVLDALPEDVLDLLEEVQIEGAQVLPEIWETLEQIHLTMEKLNLMSVSLAPTPSGVPAISAAMSSASDSIAAELAAL